MQVARAHFYQRGPPPVWFSPAVSGIPRMVFFIPLLGVMWILFFCISVVFGTFLLAGAIFFVYPMLPFLVFPGLSSSRNTLLSADALLFPVFNLQVTCSST